MTKQRICLAASGGGHLRQLLDLQYVWKDFDAFFVTEPTALGKSIGDDHPVHFVEHFAWGQVRLGHWKTMVTSAWRNMMSALRIIRTERPDILITTGAGSIAPLLFFARLSGAKVVLIDSFARFNSPSLFARLAGRWAHVRIAQSAESARHWKGALIFDPFVRLDGPRPSKEPLLFATVGATLPFPRLIDWVEQAHKDGVLPSDVIVQHGGDTRPLTGMESYDSLPFKRLGEIQDKADIVVCHGGTGSIITALQRGCHVIVIPREFTRGEHYDEHQSEIAEAFAARGLIQVASSYEGFVAAFAKVNNRAAPMATTNPDALGQWLRHYIGLRRLD